MKGKIMKATTLTPGDLVAAQSPGFVFETPASLEQAGAGLQAIIQPEDADFFLYTPAITLRAQAWAQQYNYALAKTRGWECAHALWATACPKSGCSSYPFDHTTVWPEKRGYGEPFVLTHPYRASAPEDFGAYARAHGLELTSEATDGWYSSSTTPVRLTYHNAVGVCALEREATAYLYARYGVPPNPRAA